MSDLDLRILDGIKGHTESDPADLAHIILAVDFYERIVLGERELVGGLSRLMRAGKVEELPGHRFFESTDVRPRSLSSITADDVDAAQREAHRRFWAADRTSRSCSKRRRSIDD